MRIPGLKSLRRSARWLRSRFVDSAVILGYHRIAETTSDPYSLCVSPKHFAEQLEAIRTLAHPMHLPDMIRALEDGQLPRRAVVLTFDDGYADNLYNAKPLLARWQVPATVFVATGCLGREFWWDELARVLLAPAAAPGKLRLAARGNVFEWEPGNGDKAGGVAAECKARRHLLLSLYRWLLPLSADERDRALSQLRPCVAVDAPTNLSDRALTREEVMELFKDGLIEAGTHTVTHPTLAVLPLDAQQREIRESKELLEEILGRRVTGFSYPNGSLSPRTVSIVREAGYDYACTSFNDVASRGSDRVQLPRLWVPDWDGVTFSRWLRRWLSY